MFSCEFCKIFKNKSFIEHIRAASESKEKLNNEEFISSYFRGCGADIAIYGLNTLKEKFKWINTEGVVAGSFCTSLICRYNIRDPRIQLLYNKGSD